MKVYLSTIVLTAGTFVLAATKEDSERHKTSQEPQRVLHGQEEAGSKPIVHHPEQTSAANNVHHVRSLSSSSSYTKITVYHENSSQQVQQHHVAASSPKNQNHMKPSSNSAASIHETNNYKTSIFVNPDVTDSGETKVGEDNNNEYLLDDIFDWVDIDGDDCRWYEKNVLSEDCVFYDGLGNYGIAASQACTHCNGGGLRRYQNCGDYCTRSIPAQCNCYPECYIVGFGEGANNEEIRLNCTDPLNLYSDFDPDSIPEEETCECWI